MLKEDSKNIFEGDILFKKIDQQQTYKNIEQYVNYNKIIDTIKIIEYNFPSSPKDITTTIKENKHWLPKNLQTDSQYITNNHKYNNESINEIKREVKRTPSLESILLNECIKEKIEQKQDNNNLNKYLNTRNIDSEKQNIIIKENKQDTTKLTIEQLLNTPYSKINTQGMFINTKYNWEINKKVTATNIAEFILPLVEYIRVYGPDCVIACDRGARIIGLAVYKMYTAIYGRFPTIDGTLKFRKISKKDDEKGTIEYLRPLTESVLSQKEKPKVLILDDWIAGGITYSRVKNIFYQLGQGKIDIKFGVLSNHSGTGDVTGTATGMDVDWHDKESIIGIRYSGFKGEPVKKIIRENYLIMREQNDELSESIKYRKQMYKAINDFVNNLRYAQDEITQHKTAKIKNYNLVYQAPNNQVPVFA